MIIVADIITFSIDMQIKRCYYNIRGHKFLRLNIKGIMCKSISELRKSKKLSQGDAARILGLHQSAISHIETGRKRPSLEVALQMASLLGATVEDLFGDCRTPVNVSVPESHRPTATESQLPA